MIIVKGPFNCKLHKLFQYPSCGGFSFLIQTCAEEKMNNMTNISANTCIYLHLLQLWTLLLVLIVAGSR